MKKLIKSIIFILLATMALFCGCTNNCAIILNSMGCAGVFDVEDAFIEEGDFIYYYLPSSDCYAIVGTAEQGFKQNVYVPTHFRGKEVKYTAHIEQGFAGGTQAWALEVKNCERLYFNYLHIPTLPIYSGDVKIFFFSNSTEEYSSSAWNTICSVDSGVGYVSPIVYERFRVKAYNSYQSENFSERNDYIIYYKESYESMIKANIAFMFNYNGAPNNDYFFIDNYESESLIKEVPYEPTRKGYKFVGWYKEAECISEWDFDNDRLPKFEYDSDGYVTNFVETKLYAKWEKL